MGDPATAFTYADYLKLPGEGRFEVLDGVLVPMTPAPSFRHQGVVGELYLLLRGFVDARDLGKVVVSPVDVVLSETCVVQPDVVFVRRERLGMVGRDVQGAPDLVVEVLSPSTAERDRAVKRGLYARAGVPECWLVDPEGGTVEVLALREGAYVLHGRFAGGERLTSATLEGLAIEPVEAVFRG